MPVSRLLRSRVAPGMANNRGLGLTLRSEPSAEDCLDSRSDQPASAFVREYLPVVRRIVFPMVLDHNDTDDITQEVMVKAIRGLQEFRGDAKLSTWVTRIALNTTFTFLERRKRRSAESLRTAPVDRSLDDSPPHAAIGNELDAKVRSSLEELSPKLRAAIVLTAIHGISPRDAAEIEECEVSTMHWRIHEARKQLERRLGGFLDREGEPQ